MENVFQEIYTRILKNFTKNNGNYIIGIGGNTGSGKSTCTSEFADYLLTKGVHTLIWENDLYQAPRAVKRLEIDKLKESGADSRDDWWKIVGEIYYENYDRELLEEHLTKLRNGERIPSINLYGKISGEWDNTKQFSPKNNENPLWVLHDGVYLFHPKVERNLDYLVFVSTGDENLLSHPELGEITNERLIRYERVKARGLSRNPPYNVPYKNFLPLDIHTSKHIRDNLQNFKNKIIVDNSDFKNRKIIN